MLLKALLKKRYQETLLKNHNLKSLPSLWKGTKKEQKLIYKTVTPGLLLCIDNRFPVFQNIFFIFLTKYYSIEKILTK